MSEAQNVPPMPEQAGWENPTGQPAGLLARFLARLIDGVVLAIVATLIVIAFAAVTSDGPRNPFVGSATTFIGFLASAVTVAISIGYYALLESSRGQTLGKMVMGIEVRGPHGEHPTVEVAVKRNLWMALSIIPLLGGLLQLLAVIAIAVTINANRNGSGWHDVFAGGTRVVKV